MVITVPGQRETESSYTPQFPDGIRLKRANQPAGQLHDNEKAQYGTGCSSNKRAPIGSQYACCYRQGSRPWGYGGRGQSAPPRGIFKGDAVPLKWSFSIFSSIRKDGAGRGLGARPEPPPTPGPARSDRSKALKRQISYSAKLKASTIPAPPEQGENPFVRQTRTSAFIITPGMAGYNE